MPHATHEFLHNVNGAMIPFNPPQYVPLGDNPEEAARRRSADGGHYATRRIIA